MYIFCHYVFFFNELRTLICKKRYLYYQHLIAKNSLNTVDFLFNNRQCTAERVARVRIQAFGANSGPIFTEGNPLSWTHVA